MQLLAEGLYLLCLDVLLQLRRLVSLQQLVLQLLQPLVNYVLLSARLVPVLRLLLQPLVALLQLFPQLLLHLPTMGQLVLESLQLQFVTEPVLSFLVFGEESLYVLLDGAQVLLHGVQHDRVGHDLPVAVDSLQRRGLPVRPVGTGLGLHPERVLAWHQRNGLGGSGSFFHEHSQRKDYKNSRKA